MDVFWEKAQKKRQKSKNMLYNIKYCLVGDKKTPTFAAVILNKQSFYLKKANTCWK